MSDDLTSGFRWQLRRGNTRSHSEHGREDRQRRWYLGGTPWESRSPPGFLRRPRAPAACRPGVLVGPGPSAAPPVRSALGATPRDRGRGPRRTTADERTRAGSGERQARPGAPVASGSQPDRAPQRLGGAGKAERHRVDRRGAAARQPGRGRPRPGGDRARAGGRAARRGAPLAGPSDRWRFGPFARRRQDEEPAAAGPDAAGGRRSAEASRRAPRSCDGRPAHGAAAKPDAGPSRPPAAPTRRRRKRGPPTCSRSWLRLAGRKAPAARHAHGGGRRVRRRPRARRGPHPAPAPRACPTRRPCASSSASRQYRIGNYAAATKELEVYVELTRSVDQHPVLMDCYRARRHGAGRGALAGARRGVAAARARDRGSHRLAGALADQGGLDEAIALLRKRAERVKRRRSTTCASGTRSPTSRSGPATWPAPARCSTACAAPTALRRRRRAPRRARLRA